MLPYFSYKLKEAKTEIAEQPSVSFFFFFLHQTTVKIKDPYYMVLSACEHINCTTVFLLAIKYLMTYSLELTNEKS